MYFTGFHSFYVLKNLISILYLSGWQDSLKYFKPTLFTAVLLKLSFCVHLIIHYFLKELLKNKI